MNWYECRSYSYSGIYIHIQKRYISGTESRDTREREEDIFRFEYFQDNEIEEREREEKEVSQQKR